jgi:hypothetical protein
VTEAGSRNTARQRGWYPQERLLPRAAGGVLPERPLLRGSHVAPITAVLLCTVLLPGCLDPSLESSGRAEDDSLELALIALDAPPECEGLEDQELSDCASTAWSGAAEPEWNRFVSEAEDWRAAPDDAPPNGAAGILPFAIPLVVWEAIGGTVLVITAWHAVSARLPQTDVAALVADGRRLVVRMGADARSLALTYAAAIAVENTSWANNLGWKQTLALQIASTVALTLARAETGCENLPQRHFSGLEPCLRLTFNEGALADELVTVWGTAPTILCPYDPGVRPAPRLPFGERLRRRNGAYHRASRSISWDRPWLDVSPSPAAVLAHEWGHLDQEEGGVWEAAHSSGSLEPQADCLAGVFAAIETLRGRWRDAATVDALELLETLGAQDGTHGTGTERMHAFVLGLVSGLALAPRFCASPLSTGLSICAAVTPPRSMGGPIVDSVCPSPITGLPEPCVELGAPAEPPTGSARRRLRRHHVPGRTATRRASRGRPECAARPRHDGGHGHGMTTT